MAICPTINIIRHGVSHVLLKSFTYMEKITEDASQYPHQTYPPQVRRFTQGPSIKDVTTFSCPLRHHFRQCRVAQKAKAPISKSCHRWEVVQTQSLQKLVEKDASQYPHQTYPPQVRRFTQGLFITRITFVICSKWQQGNSPFLKSIHF